MPLQTSFPNLSTFLNESEWFFLWIYFCQKVINLGKNWEVNIRCISVNEVNIETSGQKL